jgi:uncharacterized protein (TIGR00251 family)
MSADRVVRSHSAGAILTVWVVPGASKTEIVGYHGDALRIRVTAAPEQGRANTAVIGLLEKTFGCPIRLVAGARSRRKHLVAVGVSTEDLVRLVDQVGS